MPDLLAIVSKAVFEKDARLDGKTIAPGQVWPVDRYTSANKALSPSDVTQILAAVKGAPLLGSEDTIAPPKQSKPKPSRVIGGKYQVLRELGRGGMGVVYEALHAATGRRVAVKEIAIGNDARLV